MTANCQKYLLSKDLDGTQTQSQPPQEMINILYKLDKVPLESFLIVHYLREALTPLLLSYKTRFSTCPLHLPHHSWPTPGLTCTAYCDHKMNSIKAWESGPKIGEF